ncbi:hypothetical protein [Acinetobacter defluvii]|nr:hypothetical protein [Acinetobacter defluvii]
MFEQENNCFKIWVYRGLEKPMLKQVLKDEIFFFILEHRNYVKLK